MSHFLIRTRDGGLVGTHIGPAAEQVNISAGETAERFDTRADFETRLAELTPAPGPDPDDELEAALADAAAKATVEEKVDAMLAALRGRSGHQGQVAGRRPE